MKLSAVKQHRSLGYFVMCAHVHIPLPDVQSHINNVMYTGETSNVVTDLCCKELE